MRLSPDSFAYMLTIYGYGDNEEGSSQARRYPLSYVFSAYYYWADGNLHQQNDIGLYWSNASSGTSTAYHLRIDPLRLIPQLGIYNKYCGRNVRCTPLALYWLDGIRWGW